MLLNSQNDSRWIPTTDIALIYIALCLWWGLLNRLSAMRWSIHREIVVPMTIYAQGGYDFIVNGFVELRFSLTMMSVLVRQTAIVLLLPPQKVVFWA